MLIYLNDYDSHGGNTKFMSHSCSESLKKAGYIFGDLHKRVDNLEPLAKAKGFELEETMYTDIRAGDALLFAPCEIAHIGKIPDKAARHVLQLCFVPSPYPWEFTRTRVMKTITKASAFEGVADKILRFANAKKENQNRPGVSDSRRQDSHPGSPQMAAAQYVCRAKLCRHHV